MLMAKRIQPPLKDTIFDLDDLCDRGWDGRGSRCELLLELKLQFPELKVTLFAIPGLSSLTFLSELAKENWIELAVHGWTHQPNTECEGWSELFAHQVLVKVESWGVFQKVLRHQDGELLLWFLRF